MRKRKLNQCLALAALNCFAVGAAFASDLHIGDTAPQLRASQWVKGQPVKNFEKGQVYVVEFWATWCGPCKRAMPHLSELARKLAGKATFIGADVWERGVPGQSVASLVTGFVNGMGDKMDYNVCMDSGNIMVKNWLDASGQGSIPCTFVVDKDGKVAWIGNPTSLEEPLNEIIAGTFDSGAFRKQFSAEQEAAFAQKRKQAAFAAAIKPIEDALAKKDYAEALADYDKLTAQDPSFKRPLSGMYYEALVNVSPDKAYAEAIAAQGTPGARVFASVFANQPGLDQKFYKYAIEFYESQPGGFANWPNLMPQAAAYFNAGEPAKAAEIQQKFLDVAKTFTDPMPAEYLAAQQALLRKYQDAVRKHSGAPR